MNNNMTHEDFMVQGYTMYPPSQLDSEAVDAVYQRCYTNDVGKMYYITFKHWHLIHPTTGEDLSGYEGYCQVNLKENGHTVNIQLLDSDIKEAEIIMNWLFNTGKIDYYERWDA